MEEVQIYYLKPEHLSDEHKKHISEGMLSMYALKNHKRSALERKHISEGMKRAWKETKRFWREQQ